MNTAQWKSALQTGAFDSSLASLYGKEHVLSARQRAKDALEAFEGLFGPREEVFLLSVPGRSELSGNHTDHNRGNVIATSVNLDILAVAAKTKERKIQLASKGYGMDTVCLDTYTAPRTEDFGNSSSLIAGMCAGFAQNQYRTGGFVAYTTSNVPAGSGLSSSAAFEVTVGNILNHLYNGGTVENTAVARIAQYAENVFFGKPCGQMDQLACAVGGIIFIDFEKECHPQTERIDFDMTAAGYRLCIVNTRGNHANLTPDYAAIPAEMKAVANALGKEVLRDADEAALQKALPTLRATLGDRALLRALHFFAETKRATAQKKALQAGDIDAFFELVKESGRSSFCYLQNVYSPHHEKEQGLSLALCLTDGFLKDKKGAFRVHGGGFAGTIQAFIAHEDVAAYQQLMDGIFGEGACMVLHVRATGATSISLS